MGAPAANGSSILLAIGDSVVWGQGLQDEFKFYQMVCDNLAQRPEYAGITPAIHAHSGAVIGVGLTKEIFAPPEVPFSYPTILQQCENYGDDPAAVKVVLLDGGINDVSLQKILDPATSLDELTHLVDLACYQGMVKLLGDVKQKFTGAKIVVTGYYQILSPASERTLTGSFLVQLGIIDFSSALHDLGFSNLITLSHEFWKQSDARLAQAVKDVDPARITFVPSGFTEANSLFQDNSLLWGLNGTPPFVTPQDPFYNLRAQVCPGYCHSWAECTTCRFASVGHPNANGAWQYLQRILELAFP